MVLKSGVAFFSATPLTNTMCLFFLFSQLPQDVASKEVQKLQFSSLSSHKMLHQKKGKNSKTKQRNRDIDIELFTITLPELGFTLPCCLVVPLTISLLYFFTQA
jgi:hypothetical protein